MERVFNCLKRNASRISDFRLKKMLKYKLKVYSVLKQLLIGQKRIGYMSYRRERRLKWFVFKHFTQFLRFRIRNKQLAQDLVIKRQ